MITDRPKFATKITLHGIYSFRFIVGINSKSLLWHVYSVQQTSPNFLRRPTRVDNTADNADITQSQSPSTIESRDTRPRRMHEQLVHRQPITSSRILRCGHSTQYNHLVNVCISKIFWSWQHIHVPCNNEPYSIYIIRLLLPTALAGKLKQSIASVCPSIRPSVCPFPLFERSCVCLSVCVCVCHDHNSRDWKSRS